MGRFIREDCNLCGVPQISLEECPICNEGYCQGCVDDALYECWACGRMVCKEHLEWLAHRVSERGFAIGGYLCTDCAEENELKDYQVGDPYNLLTKIIRRLEAMRGKTR